MAYGSWLFMIGIFDSGVGGLSVLREIRAQMPSARLIYFGDTAHVPYGPRSMAQICEFSETITRFLLAKGAKVIVIACHTASAAALKYLRERFPDVPFVGMEPAVKPAAEITQSKTIGVLATQVTFQGELFASVVSRFADTQNVRVLTQVCAGLVQQIEAGELDTPKTEAMLRGWVEPILAQGADALVLGCTHYPFIAPLLQKICAGRAMRIIDPAPAVARQASRVASALADGHQARAKGYTTYYATGDMDDFRRSLRCLLGINRRAQSVHWQGEQVVIVNCDSG